MPFYLLHIGDALWKLSTMGNLDTLSLPSLSPSVQVSTTSPVRGAILAKRLVLVNGVVPNLAFNPLTGALQVLNIDGPGAAAPTLTTASAGAMEAAIYRYRYTFAYITNSIVEVESPFSDYSLPITVEDGQKVVVAGITTSSNPLVNARRLYRTANNGAEYYLLNTIQNNTSTSVSDELIDYDLALLGTPISDLGNAPGHDSTDALRFLVAWKDRLWGPSNNNKDLLYYCGLGKPHAWAANQHFSIKPLGVDEFGVTGAAPRRDELVILKRRAVWKLTGTDESDFQLIQVAEGPGCESFDTCLVVRDKAYFLGENAFWSYGPEGLVNLSRDQVHPWFATDEYFNRGRFRYAFSKYDPESDTIAIHLAAAGSSVEDRWVTFDIRQGIWLGPHTTDVCTPTCAATVENANGSLIPVVGCSSGSLYWDGGWKGHDDGLAIDFEVLTKFHTGQAPDREHYWGELSMLSKVQGAGTLSIVPYVGGLDATASPTISHNLTTGRERLVRIGAGRLCALKFKEDTVGQEVEIYGYEIPVQELGRR